MNVPVRLTRLVLAATLASSVAFWSIDVLTQSSSFDGEGEAPKVKSQK